MPSSGGSPFAEPGLAPARTSDQDPLSGGTGDMKYDPNRNAKVIVPLAIAVWLAGTLVFKEGVPAVFEVVFVAAFAIAVPVVVFYLIGEAGWRALARRYRAAVPFAGTWTPCPTAQMALVSVDHPEFHKVKMRFVGGCLRVATTADALHLTTMVSGLPVLGWFFPALQIPWAAVSKSRAFEAPGRFRPASEPGTLLQVAYDPNYTGTFIEMEIGDPTVFVQLPAALCRVEGSKSVSVEEGTALARPVMAPVVHRS